MRVSRSISRLVTTCCLIVLAAASHNCRQDPEAVRQARVAAGDQYLKQRNFQAAANEYRNALALNPRDGRVRLKFAEALEEIGDINKAFAETVRGADLLPDDADAQIKAGNFMLVAAQFEDARTRAEKVLEKNPRNAQAQILLANSLAGLKASMRMAPKK